MDRNNFFKKCMVIMMTAAMCVTVTSCKKEEKKSALEEASTSEEQTRVLEEARSQSGLGDEAADSGEAQISASPSAADEAVIGGADGPTDIVASDEAASSSSEVPASYEAGTLTDTTYESRYIGVRFSMPEGYEMIYTPEDIQHLNEQLAHDENEGQRGMKYEMAVQNTTDNIQVIVSVDSDKGDYDEITYLSNVAANYEQSVGAEIDRNPSYATIAGQQYIAMRIKHSMGNILYCVRKNGTDMISFIISYPDGADDKLSTVMNSFTPY